MRLDARARGAPARLEDWRMATVTFDHVWKKYGDVVAVNDLNLQIQDEEFLVLVGPSGCGKTTSLRMIAGLEEISEGTLKIGDRVVNDLAPKDRDVAMVFQSYALYPHMSVYDNLAFGLKLRKTPKSDIDRRVKEAAEILGLQKFLDRKPKALSGGQRQRLGTTTVYVTHDQVEAMTMGDRIAVMRDGVLQQVGTPQELYDHPINVFVAGFIGSPAMNFATTTSEGKDLILGGHKLELTGDQARAADSRPDGSQVLVGFRPEHIELANGQESDAVRFPAKVDVVEYLGSEELIHAQAEGNEIVALLPSDKKVGVGDQVQLAVPMEKLHIFDPESEKALAG